MISVIIFFLFTVLVPILNAQNFKYKADDWYVINKPGNIRAITENRFNVYFASENGIYVYNKSSEDFELDDSFSKFKNIIHFHYDSYHDYFWTVTSESLYFKSSISSIWREIEMQATDKIASYNIDRIGSSPQFFWIESMGRLIPFDPLSGIPADLEEAFLDRDFISWSSSSKNIYNRGLDISKYSIDGDWTVGLNDIYHKNGQRIKITVHLEDDENNQWYGTDIGYILKGWSYSSRLEIIRIGLPFDDVTVAYFDDESWWFADSKFKRTGIMSTNNSYDHYNTIPFISRWHEKDNFWEYYYSNESIAIESIDINSILRIGGFMYFGTMSGLLYLDLYNRDWNLISTVNGLNDAAIWDIVEYDGSIYVATSNGINEISTTTHSIVSNKEDSIGALGKINIFDLESDSVYLYIASSAGLFKIGLKDKEIMNLSEKVFRKISLEGESVMGMNNKLWSINYPNEDVYIDSNVQSFDICGSYIWISNKNGLSLMDLDTSEIWEYEVKDGIPGGKVYEVNCDENWAWFLTNKGMAFYNWSKYH